MQLEYRDRYSVGTYVLVTCSTTRNTQIFYDPFFLYLVALQLKHSVISLFSIYFVFGSLVRRVQ